MCNNTENKKLNGWRSHANCNWNKIVWYFNLDIWLGAVACLVDFLYIFCSYVLVFVTFCNVILISVWLCRLHGICYAFYLWHRNRKKKWLGSRHTGDRLKKGFVLSILYGWFYLLTAKYRSLLMLNDGFLTSVKTCMLSVLG